MSSSNRMASVLLALYKNINRSGLLNFDWAQSAFVSGYFAYKKYLEDANAKFVKNYPALFRGGHILDIGANIGYTAYIFSQALAKPYKVFAFEPEQRNVAILRKVANSYHFNDNLVITAAAVGDKEGEIELWQNDGHHADHRVITEEFRKQLKGTIQTQKIPLTTIDQFLQLKNASHPIAFIKIDVQGYELAVCHGMEATLKANPQCVVGFEYCPSIMEALGYRAAELIKFFQDKKYFFYRLNKNGTLNLFDVTTNKDIKLGKDYQGYFDIICSQQNLI